MLNKINHDILIINVLHNLDNSNLKSNQKSTSKFLLMHNSYIKIQLKKKFAWNALLTKNYKQQQLTFKQKQNGYLSNITKFKIYMHV